MTTVDQLLALLAATFRVELTRLESTHAPPGGVSGHLGDQELPTLDATLVIDDASLDSTWQRHPLVEGGLRSLLGLPVGDATLWLGTSRVAAFEPAVVTAIEGWRPLLAALRTPPQPPSRYRALVEALELPAVHVRGEQLFLNHAAEALTGFVTHEVPTLDAWFALAYGEESLTVRAMYEVDRRDRFSLPRRITFRRKDGSPRWFEFRAGREGDEELWLLDDVTERISNDTRFRVLFDQSSTAFVLFDDLGVIDCNPAAVSFFGYAAKAELLRQNPLSVSAPRQEDGSSSELRIAEMKRIALEQGSHRFDWRYCTATGGDAHAEVTLTALAIGHRPMLLAELHDIADRRRHELELEKARDAALSFARARSDFLATMSHEIRTPMNGVIGMTQLLLDTTLSDQQREYVRTLKSCGEGLLSLINDILDFSRIEAGKVQLESVPYSVREVVEDAVAVVAPQAHTKQLELTCALGEDVPGLVWGDPARVRQVLINLLANAVKFTLRGTVELAVVRGVDTDGRPCLRFSVHDTGIGISPEAITRLFSAFSQADASTTRRFGGSGLGLVICRGLTQLMSGALEVESGPTGSTFHVQLPLRLHTEAAPPPDLRGHTLALLERRAASRASLLRLLAPTGVTVVTPESTAGLAGTELVLADQGFDDEPDFVSSLAKRGHTVGLLRRLDGSVVDETAVGFVLSTPVRRQRLFQQLERHLLRSRPFTSSDSVGPRRAFNAQVLVAEDNVVNQRVVRGLLEKLGCEVTIAGNGAEAVETIARRRFDLVLMDCQMPELDGFAATQRIRATQRQHVPIVALTAGVMDGERERCLAAGMDEFLSKPVRLQDLERTLDRWVDPRRAA